MAVPASALSSVDRIRTTVVLPAPFEPSRAKMVPGRTSKSTPFSTLRSLNDFCNPCTCMAGPAICSDMSMPSCGLSDIQRAGLPLRQGQERDPESFMAQVTVVLGDIVTQRVDAVVNAANNAMRGG